MRPLDRRAASGTGWDDLTAADRFATIWEALADVLGTVATATLLRRAIQEAADRSELHGLAVERDGFSYGYALPACWQTAHEGKPVEALAAVLDALRPLLVELTGPVVIRRLERIGAFAPLGAPGVEDRPVGETRP